MPILNPRRTLLEAHFGENKQIVELICAIELSKLRIENNRLLKDKTENSLKILIVMIGSDIKKWTEELKELRQLRRAKSLSLRVLLYASCRLARHWL